MQLILQALKNLFPDLDTFSLKRETRFADIPGWDSMNAVNFVAEIESLTGCRNLDLQFGDELTISQVIDRLSTRGISL